MLDDADERKLGEYTPFGAPAVGDRHIWNTPSPQVPHRVRACRPAHRLRQPSPAKKSTWDIPPAHGHDPSRIPGAQFAGSPARPAPQPVATAPSPAASTAEANLKKMLGLGGAGAAPPRPVPVAAMSAEELERQMLQGRAPAHAPQQQPYAQPPPQYAQPAHQHVPPQHAHQAHAPQAHAQQHQGAQQRGGKQPAHTAAPAPAPAGPAATHGAAPAPAPATEENKVRTQGTLCVRLQRSKGPSHRPSASSAHW